MKPKFYLDNSTAEEIEYCLLSIDLNEKLSKKEFYSRFENKGWSIGTRYFDNLSRLHDLSIFQKHNNSFELTALGNKMKKVLIYNAEIFFELFHYLQYYHSINGREYFYTYKIICNLLANSKISNNLILKQVIEELEIRYGTEKIAIDVRSITKTINWLKAMGEESPIVKTNKVVLRNRLKIPEVILLAINYEYELRGYKTGFPLMLEEETKKSLCQFCFIEEITLSRYIDLLVERGILRVNMGSAGNAIILDDNVNFEKLIEEYVL